MVVTVAGLADATVDSVQQMMHLPNTSTRYRGPCIHCFQVAASHVVRWQSMMQTFRRTYISVLCGGCGSVVGRCYEAMEPHLEHLQHRFLLDTTSVSRSDACVAL